MGFAHSPPKTGVNALVALNPSYSSYTIRYFSTAF
jgi:hypothetical protein